MTVVQTPGPPPAKQDPLKDSIDKNHALKLNNKAIPVAKQWVAKTKLEKGEEKRSIVNRLLQSTDSTVIAGIASGKKKTERMEKELSPRSENFAKLVGAKSSIMSLWKVDDDATQELMVSFY